LIGLDVLVSTVVGSIGGMAGKWLDNKIEKDRMAHEKEMAKVGLEEKKLEIDNAEKLALIEANKEEELAAYQSFSVAQQSLVKKSSSFVETARALTRIIVTAYLVVLSSWIAFDISVLIGGFGGVDVNVLTDIYKEVIMNLLNLTAVAVGFWFGSRPNALKR